MLLVGLTYEQINAGILEQYMGTSKQASRAGTELLFPKKLHFELIEKPAENQTICSIRLASHLVRAPNSLSGGHEFDPYDDMNPAL
jgi:hypothetical protein